MLQRGEAAIMERKKYLLEALDVNEILKSKSKRICIVSGVGSGKNYFVEHELPNHGNVLYVTSRRAKVNEVLAEKICEERIHWERADGDVLITTNYGIEQLVKSQKFNTGIKNIGEHFHYIVIDEVHSLYTDATFSDSPFHLWTFLSYIADKFENIRIILMTGTPEPLEGNPLPLEYYDTIDKREECINVVPAAIRVITKSEALELIGKMKSDEKTIYYSNSATGIVKGKKSIYERLKKELGGIVSRLVSV